MMEIERKFLVNPGWQEHVQSSRTIVQGYLSFGHEGIPRGVSRQITNGYLPLPRDPEPEVRVRVIKENEPQAFLTFKSIGGLVRDENERSINVAQAEFLLTTCKGSLIEKVRHHIFHNGVLFEVDEYQGRLAGLVVAEVELTSIDQKIELPSWIGEEVTDLPEYKNAALAQKSGSSHTPKMK